MDLFGAIKPETPAKKRYGLVVVDDYSRFTWVEFLRSKEEVAEKLAELIIKLQNRQGCTVMRIRSDNGTEFVNGLVLDFCAAQGISHEHSAPRQPQQNGLAERRNRTLKEAARTMLAEGKVAQKYWAEAVNTACYTQNRSIINARFNKTPMRYSRDVSLLFPI